MQKSGNQLQGGPCTYMRSKLTLIMCCKAISEPRSESCSMLTLPWSPRENRSRRVLLCREGYFTDRPASFGGFGASSYRDGLLENTAKTRKNTLDGTLCLKFRYKGQGCSSGFHNQSCMLSCNFLLMFGKGWGWPSSQSLGCAWKRRLHISCQPCKRTWNWPKRASRDSEGAAPCRDFFAMVTF